MKLSCFGFAMGMGMGMGMLGGCANTAATPAEATPPVEAAATAQAPAPAVDASDHLVTVAMRMYSAKDYAAAADAFGRAYTEDPDNSLLFARAQALRLAGECDQAGLLYDEFMAQTDDPTYRNAVAQLVGDCTPTHIATR